MGAFTRIVVLGIFLTAFLMGVDGRGKVVPFGYGDGGKDINPTQSAFHNSTAKERLLIGGFQSGKTRAALTDIIAKCLLHPHTPALVVRSVFNDLKATTLIEFQRLMPDDFPKIRSINRQDWVWTFDNASTIKFSGADRTEQFLSSRYACIFVEELVEFEESQYLLLSGRLSVKVPFRGIWAATNPPDEDHWITRYFVEGAIPGEREVFRTEPRENERNLADGYYDDLLKRYPPEMAEMYVYGRAGKVYKEKPVYESFRVEKHVMSVYQLWQKQWAVVRSWDFGHRNPACTWHFFDGSDRWRMARELQGYNEDLYQFCRRVKEQSAIHFPSAKFEDVCDFAGNQVKDTGPRSVDVLKAEGIHPRSKPVKSTMALIDIVSRELYSSPTGIPNFTMDPQCKLSIRAMKGGYRMKDGKPFKDGVHDHVMNTVEYVALNYLSTDDEVNKQHQLLERYSRMDRESLGIHA